MIFTDRTYESLLNPKYNSSVKWIALRHILQTQNYKKLTPIILLFFTKKVKMKTNHPKTFI